MGISRRDFLRYCGTSAAAIGLTTTELGLLEEALANPSAPSVIWLQGSSCVGCSVSFLNRISETAPKTAADVLINSINLTYHQTLMSLAGDMAVASAKETYNKGGYVLVVEGGVPTAFNGAACWAYSFAGQDVTFLQAVKDFSARAAKIVCVGTCAAWGGIPAAAPNPAAIQGVKAVTGKTTINIAGCPPHPDWIVWGIVQLLIGANVTLDSYGRPTYLYGQILHKVCPRKGRREAKTFGADGLCLKEIGCRGPETKSSCSTHWFNGGRQWCIGANAVCIGCTEPTFPGTKAFQRNEY